MDMLFSLENTQREYLGLEPVKENWELVQLNDQIYLYFDGDILRKKITVTQKRYHEQELEQETTENRTLLLPKTGKGKPKKLNYTGLQSCSPIGVYFLWDKEIRIANYTTQTTWYSTYGDSKAYDTLDDLKAWLAWWIEDSTQEDLKEIQNFKNSERKHCKVKEGDFFTFRIGRREYGFGRILLDIRLLKKQSKKGTLKENHYGLLNIPAQPLIVKVYHKISSTPDVDIKELAALDAFPSQPIMDNVFYYGEYSVVGNLPLDNEEIDFPISYNWRDSDLAYLQYGMIYREAEGNLISSQPEDLQKVLLSRNFRCEGVGFGLNVLHDIGAMRKRIQGDDPAEEAGTQGQGRPSPDLRHSDNSREKEMIFKFFGLDASKGYRENCKLLGVSG